VPDLHLVRARNHFTLIRGAAMQTLIELGKWLGVVLGALTLMGLLVVGAMVWLLNHPD
jgi:hypothetical protein